MAKEKNIYPQLVMQNYMLERISLSKYRDNFIFKGGFLISSIVGLSSRATMDLDTTIKGFTLTHESITNIFKEICNIEIDDDITFEFLNVTDIRETVLSRSITNTRPRDYYDIYILYSLHKDDIDYSTLRAALEKTTIKRGSTHILNEYEDIVDTIKIDKRLHDIWIKYSKDYDYAKDISFEMA